MTEVIFTYGTLMYRSILQALLGRVPEMKHARLDDYRRCAISDPNRTAKGPVIVPQRGSVVTGYILLGLDSRELRILDLFEAAANGYDVTWEGVTPEGEVRPVIAKFYVAGKQLYPYLSAEDWSETEFERHHLADYLSQRIPELKARWRSEGLIPPTT